MHLHAVRLSVRIHHHFEAEVLSLGDIRASILAFLLESDLIGQRMVELISRHHLVARVNVPEHDLFGEGDWIFVMENEEGVGRHDHPLNPIGVDLTDQIEVHHAELCDQIVICLAQLD